MCQYDYVYYLNIHIAFKYNVSQEITTLGCFNITLLAHFFFLRIDLSSPYENHLYYTVFPQAQ